MNNRRKQLMLASAKEYCKCVVEGKTLKYNQIAKPSNTSGGSFYGLTYGSNESTQEITISGTSTTIDGDPNIYDIFDSAYNLKSNHKYIIHSTSNNFFAWIIDYNSGTIFGLDGNNAIFTPTIVADYYIIIRPTDISNFGGNTFNETFYIYLIDLTELGLDSISSASDFFATDLGKYIAKGNYLPYEPNGKFIHAQSPINFKGVNVWNEQWENGYYASGTKTIVSDNSWICCKQEIKVIPNTRYYAKTSDHYMNIAFFNGDTYISEIAGYDLDFVTPNNCNNIVFNLGVSVYNHDICINEYNENYNGKYYKYCGNKTYYEPLTYNQLVQNGNFASTDNWSLNGCTLSVLNNVGTLTITENNASNGIETGIQLGGSSHKYALVYKAYASRTTKVWFRLGGSSIAGIEENIYTTERQFKFIFTSSYNSTETLRMFVNINNLFLQNGDKVYLSNFMVIDLTNLYGAGNEPTTVNELNETDLGKAIDNGEYLPYSVSNNTYYVGGWDMYKGCVWKSWNGQLTKTMSLINLDNLSWTAEDFGMVAQLPSNFKTFEGNELASVIAEKYETAKYYDEIQDSICIADVYGYGYSVVIRYGNTQPSGFALFELATPTTENVTTRMVSRRTINVESENEIDLDFTKE